MFDRFHNQAAAALTAAAIATAAIADDKPVIVQAQPDSARSERVSFAALDLSTAKGRKALEFRVGGAIQRVCLYDLGRDGLQDKDYYACEADSWTRASAAIDQAVAKAERLALNDGAPLFDGAILVSAG